MAPQRRRAAEPGIVYLVGAGPGDPGLMTARALELIAAADVVLYDRLIPAGALEGTRADAELRYVGKRPGAPSMPQGEINTLLVEHAQAGRSVVRLKGGDPFVFGRGGEEAQAVAAAGVPFEVVPGITSGIAAPAYAGVPVTHRGDASAVAFVTGHEDPDKPETALDWAALAAFPGTLVLYMGVGRLAQIAERLVAAGRAPDEPVAVIESGTLPAQRTVSGALGDIASRVRDAELRAPAVTVVGPVAGLRDELAWLERRPLFGVRVAVTRARPQASALSARLRELGADVVEAPAIRIAPRAGDDPMLTSAIAGIEEYALVCVTSPNGADLLLDALARSGRDARALARATVAAIGPGTADALARRGVRADVVPARSVAEALVEALEGVDVEGRRVLIARAAEARDVLPDALRERGAGTEVVPLYDTVAEPLGRDALEGLARAHYVTFTASSTVDRLLDSLTAAGVPFPGEARVVSIGPVTSETAQARGLAVAVEAERHDIDGLVEALVDDALRPGSWERSSSPAADVQPAGAPGTAAAATGADRPG
jgi:uroporphyrinogen III methyltransferase / synthase